MAKTSEGTVWFTSSGFLCQQQKRVLTASFVGASERASVRGEELSATYYNYFLGNDSTKWCTRVPNYQAITYAQMYPGIDVRFHFNDNGLQYDIIAEPFADISEVRIQFNGQRELVLADDGSLHIICDWGTLTQTAPYIFQEKDGVRTQIAGRFIILDTGKVGFELSESYNPELALVIDPTLLFSTYLGGTESDFNLDLTVDSAGHAIAVGSTYSVNFPTTPQSVDETYNGTNTTDIFVTKFSPDGTTLQFSTFVGGSLADDGHAVAVDDEGSIYVTGATFSHDLPVLNPFDSSYNGIDDGYVVKIDATGTDLLYCTYLGGTAGDESLDIVVDTAGSAYVTGGTGGGGFPLVNVDDSIVSGGGFVTKLSADGSSLVYSTNIAGMAFATAIVVDQFGRATIAGSAFCHDPIPLANPFDAVCEGFSDLFLCRLSSDGRAIEMSSYLGGTGLEIGYDLAIDTVHDVVAILGQSDGDFPIQNAWQPDFGGSNDVVITTIANDALAVSSYLGAESEDGSGAFSGVPTGELKLNDIEFDVFGNLYVLISTLSPDLPLRNAFDSTGGGTDLYIAKFIREPIQGKFNLHFATYLGGSGTDDGMGMGVSRKGNLFVSGLSNSENYPLKNAYDSIYIGDALEKTESMVTGISCCIGQRGNINGDIDEKVTVQDLISLVSFLFREGQQPVCWDEADVNGNSTLNVQDLTFLVQYIFVSGAIPVLCP